MQRSLTQGPITRNMLLFALPLMCGNLLQQMYNIADTWVVGRFLGADALAAVGSSYTLMTFLTSIVLGLCMGSGAVISMQYGGGEEARMRQSVFQSFALIASISLAVNLLVYLGLNGILWVLRVPVEIRPLMKQYLVMIFGGIFATFLYNYFANLLRAIGNSMVPLVFLAVSSILNVVLDLVCVLVLHWGVQGAAIATVFSQFVSGVGIGLYTLKQFPELCPRREDCKWDKHNLGTILNLSVMTSVQQSIMNFGIRALSTVLARSSWRPLQRRSKLIPLPICRCRISATRSPPMWPRTTGPTSRSASVRASGARRPLLLCSASASACWSACLQLRSYRFLWIRLRRGSSRRGCTTSTLRGPVILASACCSCCTATTALSTSRECRSS